MGVNGAGLSEDIGLQSDQRDYCEASLMHLMSWIIVRRWGLYPPG